MNRRMTEIEKRNGLMELCEENNLKSPDILTAVVTIKNRMEAFSVVELYLGITQRKFPFGNTDSWIRSLRPPTELYFLFDKKREQNRFIKQIKREFEELELRY